MVRIWVGEEMGLDLRGTEGGETMIGMYHMKKILFSIKILIRECNSWCFDLASEEGHTTQSMRSVQTLLDWMSREQGWGKGAVKER